MSDSALMRRLKVTPLVNTSGRRPKGRAVLILPYEPEMDRARAGAIVIPPSVQEKTMLLENRARVIEIGAAAWSDEPEPRAKVGDIVLVTRFAGFTTKGADGVLYKLVNDKDIFCVCDEEADHA